MTDPGKNSHRSATGRIRDSAIITGDGNYIGTFISSRPHSSNSKPQIRSMVALATIVALAAAGASMHYSQRLDSSPISVNQRLYTSGQWIPNEGISSIARNKAGSPASDSTPAEWATLKLTVHGNTDAAVILDSITFEVVKRTNASPGVFLSNSIPCACMAVSVRYFTVNADEISPKVVLSKKFDTGRKEEEEEEEEEAPDYFDFPYKVTRSDPEVIQLRVRTKEKYVEWQARLNWVSASGPGSTLITNAGQPFRLTSRNGSRIFCIPPDDHDRWVPASKILSC